MRLPQHLTTIPRFVKSTFKSALKSALMLLTLAVAVLLVTGIYVQRTEAAVTTKIVALARPLQAANAAATSPPLPLPHGRFLSMEQ